MPTPYRKWVYVYLAAAWALALPKMVTYIGYKLCEYLYEKLCEWDFSWQVRVRLWAGLTKDGKTPERVAEEEAKRQRLLAELREGIEQLKREQNDQLAKSTEIR